MTISAMLLTATMAALDASFKSYKTTTETVSTHVVGRLVMQRLASLIRTGDQFGPYPTNPILNPELTTDTIEFVTIPDPQQDIHEVWQIAKVTVAGPTGPFELQATVEHYENGVMTSSSTRTLVRRVQDAQFTLLYDVGPRLRRATIDLTLRPDDVQADTVGSFGLETPVVRMVSSVAPRRFDD